MGVCDGHGTNGHMISDFVKKNLPKILSELIIEAIKGGKSRSIEDKKSLISKKKETLKSILPPLTKNRDLDTGDESPNGPHNQSAVSLHPDEKEGERLERLFDKWFKNNIEHRDQIIKEGFKQINDKLDQLTRIDCMMSGTTCVMVFLYRNMVVCANSGDSRAVLFTQINNASGSIGSSVPNSYWKPTSLSRDHKPDDPDEAQRIKLCGGRVEQSKLLPGMGLLGRAMIASGSQYYGPKRVWLKTKQVPGLAMTRSLGDFLAKSVGVTFEPEIKVFANLIETDKAIVIASDGIWDRVPNEEVASVVKNFYERKDPNGACQELTRISVERWQKDHGMVDDITVIVIFLNPSSS